MRDEKIREIIDIYINGRAEDRNQNGETAARRAPYPKWQRQTRTGERHT
jgi:hypothetical protein